MDLSEYNKYNEADFEPSKIANQLLLETNNTQTSVLELETSVKKLNFDSKDIDLKVDELIRNNNNELINEFKKIELLNNEINKIKPSVNHLNNSFNRLDNEITKPFNECNNLQSAIKKIHQTNKLLRSLTFAIYLITKIEEIDKSENNLSVKPFKNLYNLSVLLFELNKHLNNSTINSIKLVRDYIQFYEILIVRCQKIISYQIKTLINFSPNDNKIYDYEKILNNLILSSSFINEKFLSNTIDLVFNTSVKYSVNLILRNLNNTRYLPSYIKSLDKPAKVISQLDKILKANNWMDGQTGKLDEQPNQTSIWEYLISTNQSKIITKEIKDLNLLDKFWRDIALSVDSGVEDVVKRGGPIVKNLKDIKPELENSVKAVVTSSYESQESGKLEVRMMLNSVTNFEKRK